MRMSDSLAEKILLGTGAINSDRLLELKAEVKSTHVPLADLAVHYGLLSEEDLAQAFAKELGLPYINLADSSLKHSHLNILPEHMSRRYRVIVFDMTPDNTKLVASDAAIPPQSQTILSKALGPNYKMHITTPESLHAALDAYKHHSLVHNETLDYEHTTDSSKVLSTIQHILEEAILKGANSVHIEPGSDVLTVRFRIDGTLKEFYKIPLKLNAALNSRIKAMANLGGFGPQEGQFKVSSHSDVYRVEVLTLPVIDGEKITFNIFNESRKAPNLKSLGLWGKNLETVEKALLSKHGLLLAAGPRSAGKTTHLYGMLDVLSLGSINVLTIEDNLSFKLPGASQLTLNRTLPGYEVALNAAVKQDPEVLLIDKVLSPEVADRLVDVSSSCLVLAGVNSTNTLKSISYLAHLGIEPFRLAHHVRLIMSVRSVRKLCEDCRQEVHPTNEVLKSLIKTLGISNIGGLKGLHQLEKQAASEIESQTQKLDLSTTEGNIKRLWQAKPDGCIQCNYSGYKGRVYLQEIINMSDTLKAKLAAGTSEADLEVVARKDEFIPLRIDGLVKALLGLTSLDEVLFNT